MDETYNRLLLGVVTELQRGNKTWPTHDVGYILSQMKMEIKRFAATVYFDPNVPYN